MASVCNARRRHPGQQRQQDDHQHGFGDGPGPVSPLTIAGTAEGMKISIAADDTSIHAAVKPRGPPAPLTITGRSGAQGVIRINRRPAA